MKLTRLREVRELRGWSQSKLAEESDVSRDGISNYETGHREAWPSTAKKLADALGVEISDLVARAEELVPLGEAPREAGPSDKEESILDAEQRREFWERIKGLDPDELDKLSDKLTEALAQARTDAERARAQGAQQGLVGELYGRWNRAASDLIMLDLRRLSLKHPDDTELQAQVEREAKTIGHRLMSAG